MAKLKCKDHGKRVFVTDGRTSHRHSSNETCNSEFVMIGNNTFRPEALRIMSYHGHVTSQAYRNWIGSES